MAKKTLRMLSAALLVAAVGNALAANAYMTGNVTRVLISDDTRWGGCMAALSVSPHTKLPNCGRSWVSFRCTGQDIDTVRAYRMLDQAQLALATNKRVTVQITDDYGLMNGYCVASRIDILK